MESVKLIQYRSNLQYSVYLPYVSFGWPLCVICVSHPCCCHCCCCCCWCSSNRVFCRCGTHEPGQKCKTENRQWRWRWWGIGSTTSTTWIKPPEGCRQRCCCRPVVEGHRNCSSDTAKGKEGNRHNSNSTKTSTWLYNWGWGFSSSQWERPHGHCNRESESWSGCSYCGKNEKKVEVVVVVVVLVQVAAYFFIASVSNQEATEIYTSDMGCLEKRCIQKTLLKLVKTISFKWHNLFSFQKQKQTNPAKLFIKEIEMLKQTEDCKELSTSTEMEEASQEKMIWKNHG